MYKNLKALRDSVGLTQKEFGKSVGIAKTTYNNYETGIREPKSDFWIAVAKKYGVTIDYLMGYSDDPFIKNEQPTEDSELSKLEDELVIEFRNLPDSHKGLAAALCLAVIRELVKHQTVGIEAQSYVPAGSNR